MQLINQWSDSYNMSSSSPCVSVKGQLCEGRHRGGTWMGCSCTHLSHKTCPKCGEGVQGKKCLLKTVALAVKMKSLAKVKQPKVARVELRAGGGLHGPEKPEWRAGGMEK